jgi:hypothetical protein
MNSPLENEVAKRFGVLPNFFRLASHDPTITANLWGFALFAYLDNPLPSLFKERLFEITLFRQSESVEYVGRRDGDVLPAVDRVTDGR